MARINDLPARRVSVETYDGNGVPNLIGFDPTDRVIEAQHIHLSGTAMLGFREVRRAPTGRYNCHGLVFASRRTQIDNPGLPVDILDLLERDRYTKTEDPQPGDVVVYLSEVTPGTVDHSGLVLRRDDLGVIIVLSKWGELEEYEHAVSACPFRGVVEYWTLRE